MPRFRVPKLCHHKATGQGVVRLNGRDHYLGRHGDDATQKAYERLIGEWLGGHRQPLPPRGQAGQALSQPSPGILIADLILAFWDHAERYYRDHDGRPARELEHYRLALRPLRRLFGDLPAADFSPKRLKAVRQAMIDAGLCRNVVNQRVAHVRRVFKWAVADELIPPGTYGALREVAGLQRGRCEAPERPPVLPVDPAHVDATLPHLPPTVAAMIRLLRLTGMRPGEVCQFRPGDVDRAGPVWLYKPRRHKTAWRGKDRVIAIGPQAQAVLTPFLDVDPEAFVFSPVRAVAAFRQTQRAARQSPVQPSQRCRAKRKPKRRPGQCYGPHVLAVAVRRAAHAAGVPHWHPNQLRHLYATEARRQFGLEHARAALGHDKPDTTLIYAERDRSLAEQVAAAMG